MTSRSPISEPAQTSGTRIDGYDLSGVEKGIVGVVCLANLIPVWGFRYFPGQDTPNHLYGAEILRVLLNGSAPPQVVSTFAANLGLKSNLTFHALILALNRLGLSLELAHRLILSAYAVAFPLAALWCFRRAVPRSQSLALLFLPLTWNWFAIQGLYNYIFSLVPALLWLGILARDGGRPRGWAAVILALAALGTFFCHAGTFFFMIVVTFVRLVTPTRSSSTPSSWFASAGPLARALAPSIALALASVVITRTSYATPPTLSTWEGYDVPMAFGAFFAEFAVRYKLIDLAALGPPLLVLIGLPLWVGRKRGVCVAPSGGAIDDALRWPLRAAAVLTVLYLVLPHIVLGSDASPRLRPLIVFCLPCDGSLTLSVRARRIISALALASGVAGACLLCSSFASINRQLDDFTSGIPFVRKGARLYPMVFDPRKPSALVKPFLHAWGYYGVARDVVSPFGFAWHPTRFPYRYITLPLDAPNGTLRSDSEDEPYALIDGRACETARRLAPSRSCNDINREIEARLASVGSSYDYVLTWRAPVEFPALLLARGYVRIHAQGNMVLYATPSSTPGA